MCIQLLFQCRAGESGDKSERRVLDSQLMQHQRDVDPFTAAVKLLPLAAVGRAEAKVRHPHDIIEGGVEGYGIDHVWPPWSWS